MGVAIVTVAIPVVEVVAAAAAAVTSPAIWMVVQPVLRKQRGRKVNLVLCTTNLILLVRKGFLDLKSKETGLSAVIHSPGRLLDYPY